MQFPLLVRRVLATVQLWAVPLIVVGATVALGLLFHVRGEHMVDQQLRERLLNVVSIAAQTIDAQDVRTIIATGTEDTNAYARVVKQLKDIRAQSPHVRFSYIMRKTEDPDTLAFVADADALSTTAELDINANGMVDPDEEMAGPGDLYPGINDVLKDRAFLTPVVDPQMTNDQWGRLISAYAPIMDDRGDVVAVLGMDITADDFFYMTQNVFSVLAVLLVGLVGAFLSAYVLIIIRARHMESMRRLESDRTALIDLATHQLGVPLATFRWWLEILRDENGKMPTSADALSQLQQGVDRMSMIITSLQEASHLQKSNLRYRPSATSVAGLISAVKKEVLPVYAIKRQRIVLDVPRRLRPVHIDKKLFAGVLRELLENASSYSPEGACTTVRARGMLRGVEIQVEDRGYGIPEKDLPVLFERFRRGSNASKYKPVGNGMGLYIAKNILRKAGGSIRINSVLGKGTTLTIFLPYAS